MTGHGSDEFLEVFGRVGCGVHSSYVCWILVTV